MPDLKLFLDKISVTDLDTEFFSATFKAIKASLLI